MKLIGHVALDKETRNGEPVVAVCGKRIRKASRHVTGIFTCSTCAAHVLAEHGALVAEAQRRPPYSVTFSGNTSASSGGVTWAFQSATVAPRTPPKGKKKRKDGGA